MADRPKYVVGDTIRIELVFRHGANIDKLSAGFFADISGSDPIVLHDFAPQVLGTSGPVKEYRAVVEGNVEHQHAFGPYHCGFVIAKTASGREIGLPTPQDLPDIYFDVQQEPTDSLSISTYRFV